MLNRIAVVALGITLFVAVPQAHATDPCDPAVMSQMESAATDGFTRLSDVAVTLMKPSPPAASSSCMRNLFNIWSIDPTMFTWSNVASLLPSGVLGYTLGGFTLSQSSNVVWALITPMIQNYFSSKFGNMICGELWKGIGEAMAPIKFNGANIEIDVSTIKGPTFGGALGGLATGLFTGGFGGSVSFNGSFVGTGVTVK